MGHYYECPYCGKEKGCKCGPDKFARVMPPILEAIPKRRSKYGNKKTVLNGEVFDSKAEAERHLVLLQRQKNGEIDGLHRQVRFPLKVNGELICTWVADWTYAEGGVPVAEDRKSPPVRKRADFRIKAKLFAACYPAWKMVLT